MNESIITIILFRTSDNPIYSAELEERFGIKSTQVRDAVRKARRDGLPIGNCGGKHKGYFKAKNYEELKPTIDDLESRAMSLMTTVSRLKYIFGMQNNFFE